MEVDHWKKNVAEKQKAIESVKLAVKQQEKKYKLLQQ